MDGLKREFELKPDAMIGLHHLDAVYTYANITDSASWQILLLDASQIGKFSKYPPKWLEKLNYYRRKLSPTEKLDIILKSLNHSKPEKETNTQIRFNIDFETNRKELDQILTKLNKEGFIEWDGQKSYSITFEGKSFIENGGYIQRQTDQVIERETIKTDLRIKKLHELILSIGTIITAIGAIGVLIFQILDIL